MHAYDEMKAWVGYTPIDSERLLAFLPIVDPHVERIIDHFYDRILQSPGARAVLRSEAQVERLKVTLRRWLRELLSGPHDMAYFERRERIGRRHVEVGLAARYMFTAMAVMEADLMEVAFDTLPPDQVRDLCGSLQRVMQLDLAIMTGTYVQSRERQQLQNLQELLVRHLRLSVLMVDPAGTVAAATPATQGIFDNKPVLGRPWMAAIPAELVAASEVDRHVKRALQTGREVSLLRVDIEEAGRQRSFRMHIIPLANEHASFLLQIEELTDVVSLEARLRRSEALAQLGSMSAAVAHELRNPLAGISGAIQVIARSLPADAPYRPIMGKVDEEVRRLNALVTDLLAFARPGMARLEAVDLRQAAADAVGLVAADQPGVRFEVVGDGTAHADAHLVRQVLLNLLANAGQAVEGRGRVRIEVEDGRISVADDGPGVPPDRAEEIFQPFVTTKTRGTGLGLAISQRSARATHGDLRLAAESPLAGACFVLTLPVPQGDEDSGESHHPAV